MSRRSTIPSPSPAQDALQSNLTLARKKSWFSGARNIIARRSSHARGLTGKAGLSQDDGVDVDTRDAHPEDDGASTHAQGSGNDAASVTPLRPTPERQRTLTPKSAISSLRSQLPMSSHRQRRPALAQLPSTQINVLAAPEAIENPRDENKASTGAKSIQSHTAKSLMGSIRRISRAGAVGRPSPTKGDQAQLLSSKTLPPLPSSPMNISPPPALQLDLGPATLVSPAFGAPPQQYHRSELMRVTDPGNFPDARPSPTYYTRLPSEGCRDLDFSSKQKYPLQLHHLLDLPVDEFGFSMPSGPFTPMQDTDQPLHLDGTTEATELFERSVEHKQNAQKEQRELKKMASLDAMAEQYVSTPPEKLSPKPVDSLRLRTIEKPPADMPELSLQTTHLQTPSAGHRDPANGHWQSEDPFAPGNVIGDLEGNVPPSPTGSIKLPFRPKITLQPSDSERRQTLAEGVALSQKQIEDATNSQGKPACWTEIREGYCDRGDIGRKDSDESSNPAMEGSTPSKEARGVLRAKHNINTRKQEQSATGIAIAVSKLDTGEYGEFKTQHIFGDLREPDMPQYDEAVWLTGADLDASPTSASSVTAIHQHISKSQTPCPQHTGVESARASDVGDVFWKFSIKDWMQGSEEASAATPDIDPSPRRRSTEMNLDSVSVQDEQMMSAGSPTMTSADRAPMGNRLDFELKRSRRNTRYNTLSDSEDGELSHEDCAKEPLAMPPSLRPKLRIVTGSFKAKRDAPRGDTMQPVVPLRQNARRSTAGMSSDSIETDLKDVIAEHYAFQAAMSGVDIGGPYSSPTSEAQALLQGVGEMPQRHDSVVLTPASSNLWQEMQHGVFDTPPERSHKASPDSQRHKASNLFSRESGSGSEYIFRLEKDEATAEAPVREDTLDECLEMFQHYNKSQEMLSLGKEQAGEEPQNPFSSPASGYRPDSSSASPSPKSPSKSLPARYRSRRVRQ